MVPLATFLGKIPLKGDRIYFEGWNNGFSAILSWCPKTWHVYIVYNILYLNNTFVSTVWRSKKIAPYLYSTCTNIRCFIHCGYHSLIEVLLYTQGLRTFRFLQMVWVVVSCWRELIYNRIFALRPYIYIYFIYQGFIL